MASNQVHPEGMRDFYHVMRYHLSASRHPYDHLSKWEVIQEDAGIAMPSTHISLHVHVIFRTKHRRPVLDAEWRGRLHAYLGGALRGVEVVPVAIGGTADHVHLLLGLKATHRLADVMREVKRGSSALRGTCVCQISVRSK
jgi:Transposase IS200 like